MAHSIVPFPDRKFLMDGSLEGNMTDIKGLIMEVSLLIFSSSGEPNGYGFLFYFLFFYSSFVEWSGLPITLRMLLSTSLVR